MLLKRFPSVSIRPSREDVKGLVRRSSTGGRAAVASKGGTLFVTSTRIPSDGPSAQRGGVANGQSSLQTSTVTGCVLIGVLVTPFTARLVIALAGAGHDPAGTRRQTAYLPAGQPGGY